MNLDLALHQLTETHFVQHHVPGEGMRSRNEDPLLRLLNDARSTSGESSSRSGSLKSEKSPIGLEALELWSEISETIDTQYSLLSGVERLDRSVIGKLRVWAGTLNKPQQVANATALLENWARRIRSLLDPPRVIQLWERPCPTCKAREVTIADRRVAALHILTDRLTQRSWAECQVCHDTWPGGDALIGLARELDNHVPNSMRLDLPA